jgi:hypothetical protein
MSLYINLSQTYFKNHCIDSNMKSFFKIFIVCIVANHADCAFTKKQKESVRLK